MPADILITEVRTSKHPQVEIKALTDRGKKALAEAHGSNCIKITIAKRRLDYAKEFLKERGCCLVVANRMTPELAALLK